MVEAKWQISFGLSQRPHLTETKQTKTQLWFRKDFKPRAVEVRFFISDHMADNKFLQFWSLISSYIGTGRKYNFYNQVSWQIMLHHSSRVLTLSLISLGYKLFRASALVVLRSQLEHFSAITVCVRPEKGAAAQLALVRWDFWLHSCLYFEWLLKIIQDSD